MLFRISVETPKGSVLTHLCRSCLTNPETEGRWVSHGWCAECGYTPGASQSRLQERLRKIAQAVATAAKKEAK